VNLQTHCTGRPSQKSASAFKIEIFLQTFFQDKCHFTKLLRRSDRRNTTIIAGEPINQRSSACAMSLQIHPRQKEENKALSIYLIQQQIGILARDSLILIAAQVQSLILAPIWSAHR